MTLPREIKAYALELKLSVQIRRQKVSDALEVLKVRKRTCVAALFMILVVVASAGASAQAQVFSDMSGHWSGANVAKAVADGYVNGYPDGTFRPDATITRAEALKLLSGAGGVRPDAGADIWIPDTNVNHWIIKQGYLQGARNYGLSVGNNQEGFRPDEPATRMEVLVWALEVLGAPYSTPPEPSEPLPFKDEIPATAGRYIKAGLDLGVVTGYPDNTFGPYHKVSRAEAVVIAERVRNRMNAGNDPSLRLVLNGVAMPGLVLSERDGWIFAPARYLYDAGEWMIQGQNLWVTHANDQVKLMSNVLGVFTGSKQARLLPLAPLPASDMDLPALPYMRLGEVMLPVAPIRGGKANIPFAETVYTPDSRTVTVTYTQDWPGYHFPQATELTVPTSSSPVPIVDPSGTDLSAQYSYLQDKYGNQYVPRVRPTVTLSVDPDSPLRFRDSEGNPTLTRFVSGPQNNWKGVQLTSLPDPQVGTYEMQISLPPYASTVQTVQVMNDAVRWVRAKPKGDWKAGQEATLDVYVIYRDGRVDTSFSDLISNDAVTVFVYGPDGQELIASPVVIRRSLSMTTVYELLFDQGEASFKFTPPVPGRYQVVVRPHRQPLRDAARYYFDVAP